MNLRTNTLLTLLSFALSIQATTPSIEAIIDSISRNSTHPFCARVHYTSSMPMADDEAMAEFTILQSPSIADTISPVNYLVDWQFTSPGYRKGFSAYTSGSHFRFDGNQLREYHSAIDINPFRTLRSPGRRPSPPIHRSAQFASFVPAYIATELADFASDSTCTLQLHTNTIVNNTPCIVIDVTETIGSITALKASYCFNSATLMPVQVQIENYPDSPSRHFTQAEYTHPNSACTPPTTASELESLYPDVFNNFRQRYASIDALRGHRLPSINLSTTTGERYSHLSSDSFRAPTILALMQTSLPDIPAIVNHLRNAVDSLPFTVDIIWAFTDRRPDSIEEAVPSLRPGEHLLTGSRALARDCGVTQFPTFVIIQSSGIVHDIISGFNNQLSNDVIQKMSIQ